MKSLFLLISISSSVGSRVQDISFNIEGTHTAAARELKKIGAAEHAVMKELRGHPELQRKERNYLEEAADLMLRASQMQHHHQQHPHHATAFLHEGAHAAVHRAEAKSATSMAAEGRAMFQQYGSQMFHFAKKNLHLAKELAEAKLAVAKELQHTGISSNEVAKIEGALSKAKVLEQRIVHSETKEAKQALHEAKAMGFAQTHAAHQASAKVESMTTLKAQRRVALHKYGLGMSRLAKSNRHLSQELAQAKAAVLKALKRDGAGMHVMSEVSKDLNQARKMEHKVTSMEEHEAKAALKESHAAGLVQASSGASAMSVSALEAHHEQAVHRYASRMSHLARQNHRLGNEIARANRAIAKALKRDGASFAMQREVAAELRKASKIEKNIAAHEVREAKTAFRKPKGASLAQSGSKAKVTSMAALKMEGQMARQQYRKGMVHLASEDKATVHEMSQARDVVAAALDEVGATPQMEDQVDAWLGKAELEGRKLMNAEKHETKA
jgi:hypothetical protein